MNAAYFVPLVGITLMVLGLAGVGVAAWRTHRSQNRLDFIRSLGSEAEVYAEPVQLPDRVQSPLVSRIFSPSVRGLRHGLSRLYPSQDIDRVHADLLKAGLTGSVRAEEFVAVQVGAVMMGFAIGLIMLVSGVVKVKIGLGLLFILPMLGGLVPSYWLRFRIKGRRRERHERPARPSRPDDDLGGRRPRSRAGDAGVVRTDRLACLRGAAAHLA